MLHVEDLSEFVVGTMTSVNVIAKTALGFERGRTKLALDLRSVEVADFDVVDDRLAFLAHLGADVALEQAGLLIDFDQLLNFLLELGRGQV